MKSPKSIYRRLLSGLLGVALISTALLFLMVLFDYHFDYSELAVIDLARKAWKEIFKHVVIPVLIFALMTALAVCIVVRNSLKPLEIAASEIKGIQGKEVGYRIPLHYFPIEAKPFAKALNDLLEQLEHSAAQQEAFAADIAHELRTPLTLARLELAEIGGEAKTRLSGDLEAMQRLIDQLLLLAQVKAAQSNEIPQVPQDLVAISQECVASIAPRAILAGRTLEFESESAPVVVLGWREAIQAALRNLVENALRVTPAGRSICVSVGPDRSIRVRDGGPGLTSADLESLLQRHARAQNPSNSGAGLGLPIVSQIMRAHGGSLQTDPENCEIWLKFPDPG